MTKLSRNAIIGYPAGIITGITYGLNPLFAKPLMYDGVSTETILFFRYSIAVILLGVTAYHHLPRAGNGWVVQNSMLYIGIMAAVTYYMAAELPETM